jgi:hypothetical protein
MSFSQWLGQAQGFAFAALHWSPEVFWQATPTEFAGAMQGWRHLHGLGEPTPPVLAADITRLMEQNHG